MSAVWLDDWTPAVQRDLSQLSMLMIAIAIVCVALLVYIWRRER